MIVQLSLMELRMLRRDPRVGGTLLALALLVLLAFVATAWNNAHDNAGKRAVAVAERERWLGQGAKDAHSAAHYSIYAFKPASVLATLDSGIEPFVGQAVWLEAHKQNDLLYRPQGDYSVLSRAGFAHPASLLNLFGPLVAFLMAFTVIALDRERGTFRFALGAALRPHSIVMAKFVAVCGLQVALLILPAGIAALVASVAQHAITFDVVLRIGSWVLAMGVYLSAFTALGIAVCLLARSPRVALVGLLGLWILLAVALPRWSNSAVEASLPLPSYQSVKQRIQKEGSSSWAQEISAERERELLQRYGVNRREDLPVDLRGAMLDMSERHGYAIFDRILGGFYDQVDAQDHRYTLWGFLSPSVALHSLSMALTGSDFTHHRHFIESAESYRRELINRMNAELMKNPHNELNAVRPLADARLWQQVEEFQYAAPKLGSIWKTVQTAVYALAVWVLAAAVLLNLAMRRVRP
ncbi:MAG TPA: DUF3526 domain-containing protein [Dongiaceae bacterium]|nr:DUF3526 domain-containing protein [Dongiaceae bacterium]